LSYRSSNTSALNPKRSFYITKMAEGKKSFLLYTDIQHVVAKLTDVEAGQLFKHLLAYVNDQNPTAPTYLIEIVFEPIKQSLKRDLIKYGGIKESRSYAGKLSAEKRKQNASNSTSVESVEQTPTNSTVSVNVNDSVIIDKSIIEEKIYLESKKNWEEIVTPSKWLDALIKNNFTTKEFLIARLKEFWVIANYLENPDRKQSKDIKLHFANWLKTNPPKKAEVQLSNNPAPWANFGKHEEV
jgi:hypothetical protein